MYTIVYYENIGGKRPVEEFIDGLGAKTRAKVFSGIAMLREYGPVVGMPYAKKLTDGIFELRVSCGTDEVRILYFFEAGGQIVLTNGFMKKTRKTPAGELQRARRIRTEWRKTHG